MDVVFVISLALGGIVVASFLNAAIVRWVGWRVVLPQFGQLVAGPEALRSTPARCGSCGAALSPWGSRSISWLGTFGRCRGPERHPLARRYLVVEVLVAGLWLGAGAAYGTTLEIIPVLILFASLVAMAAVDLWVMRIPNRFIYATHALLIPSIVLVSVIDGEPGRIAGAAVGALAYFGFLFLFHIVSPRRMGFGDVRLAGVMGMVLGWLGWRPDLWITYPLAWVIWGALIGSLLGTLMGIASLIARRRSRPFPFGPALAVGCIVVVLAGESIIG